MNCPKCNELLRNEIYRQRDYQICFYCEGAWVNKNTLKAEGASETLELTSTQTDYNCPSCIDIKLLKAYSNGIELEYCPVCSGVFFDTGELEKTKPGFKDADTEEIKSDAKKAVTAIVSIGLTVALLVRLFKRD